METISRISFQHASLHWSPGRLLSSQPSRLATLAPHLQGRPFKRFTRVHHGGGGVRATLAKPQKIALIATDVDGTLLDSKQRLSVRNVLALREAMQQGVQVVIATGKARGPWVRDVLPQLGLTTPGVFLQGLLIYNPDGSIRFERAMAEDVARLVMDLAGREQVTLTAYCGERILCEKTDYHTDRLIGYGEPPPEAVGPLENILGKISVHKLILMADQKRLDQLRPSVEALLSGRATVVTALSGMLEILPLGASKGNGLAMVLHHLGVPPEQVMAVGDGENDMEMLSMVGLGVAMGNAGENVKAVADYVTASNDSDGLALAVEKHVLMRRSEALKA